ncbi:beta-hexosaminidase [Vibrio sp. 10N.286.49.B3]|uniref:beta-N-acetylhexosaminidase n=1 Tax=Vibrio sp. 10N.286.49.B3 TaxID=1880855 RepID=UPI000C865200|nr:family 20 glycosylhydrolase [Vibrio sp. 10N.286.49.B3]PMH41293.1 beta-hexosaminidase [Vibrio sp. 10N.286.49.B3]
MSYRLDFTVLSEQDNHCRLGLALHNLTDQSISAWSLHFGFERFIQVDSVTQGSLSQVGSFLTFTPPSLTLEANEHIYIEFDVGTAPLRFLTDGIKDAFIQLSESSVCPILPVMVTPIALASPYHQRTHIAHVDSARYPLIPLPQQLIAHEGDYTLNDQSELYCHCEQALDGAHWLQEELNNLYQLTVAVHKPAKITSTLNIDNNTQQSIAFITLPTLDEGHYRLSVSAQSIVIYSGSKSGFIHAAASLIQLISTNKNSKTLSIPCCEIEDSPRFGYRGMMLDCARHFHSVTSVKKLINRLAHYKFNTFHWHLTDDEGWRIEIKSLPALTDIGAWRGINTAIEPQYSHLSDTYGGFYSQAEIKHIIAYAEQRGITIIPEIDIPGHCRAAVISLPDLLIDQDDTTVYRSIQNYSDNVLNPALEGTYFFLDSVLEEVAALFPGPYLHIGADEVPNGVWLNSPKCQQLMSQEGYQEPKELQAHLLRYAEKKLKTLGKRMLGWEEAQHGNKVSKDTIIYAWQNEQAAIDCAKQGFDIVLQPAQFTYLDMVQDYAPEEPGVDWAVVLPLEAAYRYEPLAEIEASSPVHQRMLGIQCAMWCEGVKDEQRLDYLLFPRMTAIAETCWTAAKSRHWHDYLARLKGHLPLLDRQHINYRQPW